MTRRESGGKDEEWPLEARAHAIEAIWVESRRSRTTRLYLPVITNGHCFTMTAL